ncbi:MAG: hypothetical protein AAF404_22975, partial [Pseudomonadota bacterium]
SLSVFENDLNEITRAARHPHRRSAEILCKGGRRVEVTLMGDFTGAPIVTIANATNYTFSADVEQTLHRHGLYIISVCSPGCGKTDRPPGKMSREECLTADVKAVLDQLEVNRALMLAYNANSPVCYRLVNRLPGYFYRLAHVAAPVPVRFITRIDTQSSWVNGILKAGTGSPAMKRMLFKGAMKALATLGAEKYLKLQLASKPVEADVVFKPENLNEIEYAISVATQGGIADAAEDIAATFEDWSGEVDKLPVDITVVQGVNDSLYTVENVRDFVNSYSAKISMVEIDNAGFPLLQSCPDEVIGLLKTVTNR